MKNSFIIIVLTFLILGCESHTNTKTNISSTILTSPDASITVTLSTDDQANTRYSISRNKQLVLQPSLLGLKLNYMIDYSK